MANRKAPTYEVACDELDRHFSKNHQVLTTRQLKTACGGCGSNETYHEYIARWRASRVERSGALSTLLSIRNHADSSKKTIDLLLDTLSQQLTMCPLDLADVSDDAEDANEQGSAGQPVEIGYGQQDRQIAPAASPQNHDTKIDRLATEAARASEARFQGESAPFAPERKYRTEATEAPVRDGEMPSPWPAEQSSTSLSRSDTGSRQAALPLGANQSDTDERETLHDRGAS